MSIENRDWVSRCVRDRTSGVIIGVAQVLTHLTSHNDGHDHGHQGSNVVVFLFDWNYVPRRIYANKFTTRYLIHLVIFIIPTFFGL